MTGIIIFHNPRCSKSRQTLALIEEAGHQVEVIKYLETPPSEETLNSIIEKLGFDSARQLMRTKEAIYKELNLADVDDETMLVEAMSENPKLIERPIVLANHKAAIGRPPESVLDIL